MLVLFSFAPSIILFPLFNFTLYPSNPPKIKRILTKYKQQEKNLVGVWGFGKLTINLNVIQKHRLGFLGLSLKLEWNLLQRHHFQRKVAYFISKRAYFFSRIWINWKMWLSWKENWVDCLLFVYTTLAVTVFDFLLIRGGNLDFQNRKRENVKNGGSDFINPRRLYIWSADLKYHLHT